MYLVPFFSQQQVGQTVRHTSRPHTPIKLDVTYYRHNNCIIVVEHKALLWALNPIFVDYAGHKIKLAYTPLNKIKLFVTTLVN